MIRLLALALLSLFGLQSIASAQCATVRGFCAAPVAQSYAPSFAQSYAPPVTTIVREKTFPTFSTGNYQTFSAASYSDVPVVRPQIVRQETITQNYNNATLVSRDRVQITRDRVPVSVTRTVKTVTFGH